MTFNEWLASLKPGDEVAAGSRDFTFHRVAKRTPARVTLDDGRAFNLKDGYGVGDARYHRLEEAGGVRRRLNHETVRKAVAPHWIDCTLPDSVLALFARILSAPDPEQADVLSADEVSVVWAALCAMVLDVHAPQDQLTERDHETAAALFKRLDAAMNACAALKGSGE